MIFEERYNKLCDKLKVQKYYVMDINFGDLDYYNWKVQGYKSAREAYYADDHRDYTEDYEDLPFKEWYKKNINTAESDIEYRYPLFDDMKLVKIQQALISSGYDVHMDDTVMCEYDVTVEFWQKGISSCCHEEIAKTLQEAFIGLLLNIEDKNGLYGKVREILSCFNEYTEQKARDDKIYNQVYTAIDGEEDE